MKLGQNLKYDRFPFIKTKKLLNGLLVGTFWHRCDILWAAFCDSRDVFKWLPFVCHPCIKTSSIQFRELAVISSLFEVTAGLNWLSGRESRHWVLETGTALNSVVHCTALFKYSALYCTGKVHCTVLNHRVQEKLHSASVPQRPGSEGLILGNTGAGWTN